VKHVFSRLLAVLVLGFGLCASGLAMSVLPSCTANQAKDPPGASTAHPGLADRVVVKKHQRRLYLMRKGRVMRTYRVSLGIAPVGHKEHRGDNRTPEGRYVLDWRNPSSRFRKAIHISYPNLDDRMRAEARGRDPGGMIMIHGEPRSPGDRALRELVRGEDWTQGCIAVSDLAIDEIWRWTRNGTPIEILP
jgi:murein L,D-transpeptidase YafK